MLSRMEAGSNTPFASTQRLEQDTQADQRDERRTGIVNYDTRLTAHDQRHLMTIGS